MLDLVLYSKGNTRYTQNMTVSLNGVGFACRLKCWAIQLAKEMFETLKLTERLPAVVEWRASARSISSCTVRATRDTQNVTVSLNGVGFACRLKCWAMQLAKEMIIAPRLTSWARAVPESRASAR